MIYKELDPFTSDDKFAKSGRAAEEQMAFYFKRFFGSDPDVLVLNGIRLAFEGDAAQVDHLIIHPHGLAIVESKSVHGKVQIKDDGQWIRWFNGNQSRGMASPLMQAHLQERFFRNVLGKASKNEELFAKLPIDLFVAISDSGVIVWPKAGPIEGVCKADQVADRITRNIRTRALAGGALSLSSSNRQKIAAYLLAANTPLRAKPSAESGPTITANRPTETRPTPEAKPAPEPKVEEPPPPSAHAWGHSAGSGPSSTVTAKDIHKCKHCGSRELEVRYAYTYFFHCRKCEKNTPIKELCRSCGLPAKVRKQKTEFYLDCESCQGTALFFSNS